MKSGYATKREMWVDVMVCIIILGVFALMMVAHGGAVHFPSNTTYWVAYSADGAQHIGETKTNQVTVSGQPMFIASEDTLQLATDAAEGGFTNWPAMPSNTNWVDRGVYTHEGQIVAVYQSHTRQSDWTIEGTPALYGIYHGAGTAVADWVQPTGGHDAYQKGDQVLFNGKTYESVIDANVWSPTGYPAGWNEL